MNCNNYREQISSLITQPSHEGKYEDLMKHLEVCEECRREYESLVRVWNLMSEVPQAEPSRSMKPAFNIMLSRIKEERSQKPGFLADLVRTVKDFWALQIHPQLALSIVMIAVGVAGGYLLHSPGNTRVAQNVQIDSLTQQVSQMKQVMMLSLLSDQSASQRIKAVAYTDDMSSVDAKVLAALFTTLNEDPNVNVRLATLEALLRHASDPDVRAGLVKSIDLQESPLMQTAIADAMVKLQEKSSVESLRKILERKGLNQMVRVNIEKNIQKLI